MELRNKLKSIVNVESIIELGRNNEYGFSINWIKATKENPNHIIFTSGLSDTKQLCSEKYPEFEHIELYFSLPEYWKVEDTSADYQWPIEYLNRVAQVPQKNNTWFGPGDTIPAGNPPTELSSKVKANHFIIAEPLKLEANLKTVELHSKTVRFLALIPIFEAELAFKQNHSAKKLINRFQLKEITEEIDEYRVSVIKKKRFSIFQIIISLITLATVIALLYIANLWYMEYTSTH